MHSLGTEAHKYADISLDKCGFLWVASLAEERTSEVKAHGRERRRKAALGLLAAHPLTDLA